MHKKKTGVTFTDAEKNEIRSAASAVWDKCAYDVLQATADDKGKDVNDVTISRAHAIEIALDAGRAEEILRGRMRRPEKYPTVSADLLDRMNRASYDELIAIVKPSFPHSRYGM